MELNMYDLIKRAMVTSKSLELFHTLGKITFEVDKAANKTMVKDAVEKIWSVKVDRVAIINRPGKNKQHGRRPFSSSGRKKAIVTLKKGYKIDLSGLFETMGVVPQQEEQKVS
jgi:large subunit ribosomal protein L23